MSQQAAGHIQTPVVSQQLLLSLAEQLKLPLLQIARQAELASFDGQVNSLATIQTTADNALQLIDSYLLGVRLALEEPYALQMEPVSVSSVLYDAGHRLEAMAKSYDVQIELHIDGKYGPVMAHRQVLEAALTSLGQALIESLPALDVPQLKLQLGAHRCRYGIVTGLYCEAEQLTTEAFRQGKLLSGRSRQPMPSFSHTSGAGVFVANALLHAMHSELKISYHHKLHGLGAILQPNPQMHLVEL